MEAEASEGSVSKDMEADETRRKAVREGSEIGFMLPESGRDLRPDSGREIAPEFRAEIKRLDIGRWNPGAIKRGVPSTFSGGWSVRRSRFLYYEYKRQDDGRCF